MTVPVSGLVRGTVVVRVIILSEVVGALVVGPGCVENTVDGTLVVAVL